MLGCKLPKGSEKREQFINQHGTKMWKIQDNRTIDQNHIRKATSERVMPKVRKIRDLKSSLQPCLPIQKRLPRGIQKNHEIKTEESQNNQNELDSQNLELKIRLKPPPPSQQKNQELGAPKKARYMISF